MPCAMRYFVILLVCVSASCGHSDVDMEQAKFVIAAPNGNQTHAAGQPVAIRASITHNEMLELVQWHARTARTGRELSAKSFEPDASCTPSTAGRYAVPVEAEDRFSNTSVEVIEYNVQ